jgi:hypothetical protein
MCVLPHSTLDRAFARANIVAKMSYEKLIDATSQHSKKEVTREAEQLENCLRLLQAVVVKVEELAMKTWTRVERRIVQQPKQQRRHRIIFGDFTDDVLGMEMESVEKDVVLEESNEGFFDVGFMRLTKAFMLRGQEKLEEKDDGMAREVLGRRLAGVRMEMMRDGMMDARRWGDAEGMTDVLRKGLQQQEASETRMS